MVFENDLCVFSFDMIVFELVSSFDVYKMLMVIMQFGGVGFIININIVCLFVLNGFKMVGLVKGVYDENSEEIML